MSPLWYLVLVIAVLAIAGVLLLRRRSKPVPPAAEPPAVKPAPRAAGPSEVQVPAERKPETPPERGSAPVPPVEEAVGTAPRSTELVVPSEVVAKPELSAEELRERVRTSLEGSEALLQKLQGIADSAEGEDRPVDLGMLEIMREGLEEVRSLAQKKRWDQAKDKGEALQAQLSLMLRGAGRESPS